MNSNIALAVVQPALGRAVRQGPPCGLAVHGPAETHDGAQRIDHLARTHLPAERSASTIAALSVVSTVGIGVGYPMTSLIDQLVGLRAAYGVGFLLSAGALAIAWRALPAEAPGVRPRIDITGALLLAGGTLALLLVIAEPAVWATPWLGGGILVGSAAILVVWAVFELRAASPLVNLRLLGQGPAPRANMAMLIAGKTSPRLINHLTERWAYALSVAVAVAIGAGLLFAAATPTGTILPTQGGHITAALWVLPPLAASAVIVTLQRPARRSKP